MYYGVISLGRRERGRFKTTPAAETETALQYAKGEGDIVVGGAVGEVVRGPYLIISYFIISPPRTQNFQREGRKEEGKHGTKGEAGPDWRLSTALRYIESPKIWPH